MMNDTIKTTYITFKREMARAYAEGRKQMTRRVIKPQPDVDSRRHAWAMSCKGGILSWGRSVGRNDPYNYFVEKKIKCPYGAPGDQLILGTTWAVWAEYDNWKPRDLPIGSQIWSYFDSDEKPDGFGKLRPGRFLPGFLRDRMPCVTINDIRVERVQEISPLNAQLEGDIERSGHPAFYIHGDQCHVMWFRDLWDRINRKRGFSWDSNPWVWVVEWWVR
jgi:hypothetical protein